MRQLVPRALPALCLLLPACCLQCEWPNYEATRTVRTEGHRIELVAETYNHCAPGSSRGDFPARRYGYRVQAVVDERPAFLVAARSAGDVLSADELDTILDGTTWRFVSKGRVLRHRFERSGAVRRFYFLADGPGFAVVAQSDESALSPRAAALRAVREQCFANPDLLHAIALSGDDALRTAAIDACINEALQCNASEGKTANELIDAHLDHCFDHGGCENQVLELCLVARNHECHARAVAYLHRRVSEYNTYPVRVLARYASSAERVELEDRYPEVFEDWGPGDLILHPVSDVGGARCQPVDDSRDPA